MDNLGIWIGAFLTLAFWSILFKENPIFSFAEHLYVGLGAGQAIAVGWVNIKTLAINPMTTEGKISAVIPLLLGLLLYTRFLGAEVKWLNRIPTALMVGVGTGLAFTRFAQSDLVGQVRGTMLDLKSLNNLIIVLGTLATISYFFFTSENKVVSGLNKIGRMIMMIAFGSAFGNTVMGRLSLFIGRLQYLLGDWLGVL
ncbi:MAG TPA: hypothetical protein GX524_07950 [Firmicutes bacterium]|jgi:hypothetical protein|nr:hypothetical protein [Bacillota bacterium]